MSKRKTTTQDLSDIASQLQDMMHAVGLRTFCRALISACYWASDDTEDFDDKRLTQEYRYMGNVLNDAVAEMPDYTNQDYYEEF